MSLQTLAERAGIHTKTLSKWMKGTPAFLKNIKKVASVLDVSVADITITVNPVQPLVSYNITLPSEDSGDPLLVSYFMSALKSMMDEYNIHKISRKAQKTLLMPSDINAYYSIMGFHISKFIFYHAVISDQDHMYIIFPVVRTHPNIQAMYNAGLIIHWSLGDLSKEVEDAVEGVYGYNAERRKLFGEFESDNDTYTVWAYTPE